MGYIKRHMESLVLDLSASWPVILLTGPRQAGKTTMLKRLAESEGAGRGYVSLDDLTLREMARSDPKMFLQLHQPPVLIDEVQYAPELFTYIKIHVDEHHLPGGFWLTGSQIFKMMRGVQESLAGRVALLHMSPLSQREISGAEGRPFTTDFDSLLAEAQTFMPQTVTDIFQRLWGGCMPGLVSGEAKDRNVYYSSYLSTYVERDVRGLSGTMDALKFLRFVTSVAARTAQMVNYKSIADNADIDQSTAKVWMNILETLGLVFMLHPYSNNVLKRTVKTPKLYFYDTGLVCYLTRWSS
ncbi:MAG: ATP-binding protein, partial [Fretibacterium sp.]|nr:ATP-binding protein [Fretibacterium sp.]